MGVRITDLRKPARPIAQVFNDGGLSMTDLLSIGLLYLHDKDGNDIMAIRTILNANPDKTAKDILSAFEDETGAQSRTTKKKHSSHKPRSSKSG